MTTIESSIVKPSGVTPIPQAPELHTGDRLTRAEFERRYSAMADVKKAELIEGMVYMPSPVSLEEHGSPQFDIVGWLAFYRFATPGVQGGDNTTVRLDLENEPQPDAFLRIAPQCGGKSRNDGKYVAGPPELIVEISASSVSYDLHDKLRVYQRSGVAEYLVWRVSDSAVDWFGLREERFERLALTEAGHYRSEVFPGLWLDQAALIRGDVAQVLAVLQQGVASPEHADFVARLQITSATRP